MNSNKCSVCSIIGVETISTPDAIAGAQTVFYVCPSLQVSGVLSHFQGTFAGGVVDFAKINGKNGNHPSIDFGPMFPMFKKSSGTNSTALKVSQRPFGQYFS